MDLDLKMEVYTPGLELVGMLEEYNAVIWEEKAFTAGNFEIHSLITDDTRGLLVPENIIWIEGETAGIIEHIDQQAGDDGPYITVRGRTLTGILDRRILWGMYSLSGTVPEIMRYLVNDCCINPTRGDDLESRKIPGLVLVDDQPTGGTVVQIQKTGGTLLECLEALGEAYNVAFGVRFNPQLRRMEFWCRPGINRSIHQSDNDPVFYSTELDDVLRSEYTYNSTNARNIALVAGEGEGAERTHVVVEVDTEEPQPPTPPTPPATQYTISATVDPIGGGNVTGAGKYNDGATANLKATANEGYTFQDWKEGGETVHNAPDYSFTVDRNRSLTAAFLEEKPSRLPDGYTELEYIQSSGTQYINTRIVPTDKTDIAMDAEPTNNGVASAKYFFDSSRVSANPRYAFRVQWSGTGVLGAMGKYDGTVTYKTLSSGNSPSRMSIAINASKKTGSVNGNSVTFDDNTFSTGMNNIQLLTFNSNSSYAISAKLYSCQIKVDGLAVRDFVPCTNPSGEVGLYDIVGGGFYGNAGTGEFTAGPAV